ncbi:MAG: response regulator [Candidatus Omnitrophica bacterium]|nr:response regulator [Candidatus Omnitrophota bacterium]MDD5573671.1 response regulator [Candidatus Omnitrophota bacterium]
MPKTRIIIIDDDPDIRDVLNLTLTEEGYEVLEAENGLEGVDLIKNKAPNLVIVDYNMPKMTGPELCAIIKKDILLSHLPIIMLTGKSDVSDKVSGINAGADDYLVKPFEPRELMARIKMILRRTERDLDANPLTRLPGNVSILNELQERIDKKGSIAVIYADLDKFKVYNDKYGFSHGDEVIRETARLLIRSTQCCGDPDDFIGHIGGDDFVVVTAPDKADTICAKIIEEFEKIAPSFYTDEDRQAGYIMGKDRKGVEQKFGLLSISMGIVTNENRQLTHVAQIAEIGAELKEAAKRIERSSYVKDRRTDSRAE